MHTNNTPPWSVFHDRIPRFVYSTDNPSHGMFRAPRSKALLCSHIDPRHPTAYGSLTFDIDYPNAADAWNSANIPAPSAVMENPANGHAHALYVLQTEVARHEAARSKPLEYYAAVERGMTRRLKADQGYAGVLIKNPYHPRWRTRWIAGRTYTLEDLSSALTPAEMRRPPKDEPDIANAGRNVDLFHALRHWSYRNVTDAKRAGVGPDRWRSRVLAEAIIINAAINRPALPLSEAAATAKSVAKFAWLRVGTGKAAERFVQRQTERSHRAAELRTAAVATRRAATKPLSDLGDWKTGVREYQAKHDVGPSTAYADRAALGHGRQKVTIFGKALSLTDAAKAAGVSRRAFCARLRAGISPEAAFLMPRRNGTRAHCWQRLGVDPGLILKAANDAVASELAA
ncbi:MAG: replication initiation protein [Hyphomicrobium sp.]